MATTIDTPSRQVRRASERTARKTSQSTYPNGWTANGVRVQGYAPFQPRGKVYTNTGKQEAARRLARMARA